MWATVGRGARGQWREGRWHKGGLWMRLAKELGLREHFSYDDTREPQQGQSQPKTPPGNKRMVSCQDGACRCGRLILGRHTPCLPSPRYDSARSDMLRAAYGQHVLIPM
jgi:hypothetical protein